MAVQKFDNGQRVLDALGIDGTDVRSVDIHFEAGEIPTATVTHVLCDGEDLATELKRYELVERKAPDRED